jgi:hypothetical protein
LNALDNKEIGRIAEDLRISTYTLRNLVARGPDAANLLYERMRALGPVGREAWANAHVVALRELYGRCG